MGSGRIRIRTWTDDRGTPLARVGVGSFANLAGLFLHGVWELEDRGLGGCYQAWRVGGSMRCVPSSVPMANALTDDACTKPAFVGSSAPDPCGRAPTCDAELRAAQPYAGAVFVKATSGECVASEISANQRVYAFGELLGADVLGAIQIRQE